MHSECVNDDFVPFFCNVQDLTSRGKNSLCTFLGLNATRWQESSDIRKTVRGAAPRHANARGHPHDCKIRVNFEIRKWKKIPFRNSKSNFLLMSSSARFEIRYF